MSYAKRTKVPVERSRGEIEKRLRDAGADGFGFASEGMREALYFRIGGRQVRISSKVPTFGLPHDKTVDEREHARRWRCFLLIIKAKLEAVASGISTIEREFLADIVMPDGATVGAWLQPQLEHVYATGKMPPLLPGHEP